MHYGPRYMTIDASTKLGILPFLAVFVGYNPRFVVLGGFRCTVTPIHDYRALIKLLISAIFCRFHGL